MRLRESGKLGFHHAVVPQSQQISDDGRGSGVTIRPCADVGGLVAAIARISTRERTIARG
jgi:DNA repair protein RadA/Sms